VILARSRYAHIISSPRRLSGFEVSTDPGWRRDRAAQANPRGSREISAV
jgi:hypothetical protein